MTLHSVDVWILPCCRAQEPHQVDSDQWKQPQLAENRCLQPDLQMCRWQVQWPFSAAMEGYKV